MTDSGRLTVYRAVTAAIVTWLSAGSALAGQYINLGIVDGLAIEPYPQVIVQIQGPGGTPTFGPASPNNIFTLDTGSNFVTVVGDAVDQLTANGYQSIATYNAPGAGGNFATGVSQPYTLRLTDQNAATVTIPEVRLLSRDDPDSIEYGSRLGMPALMKRVTTIDLIGGYDIVNEGEPRQGWPVRFGNAPLPNAAGRYHLPIELYEVPLAGQVNPGDPLPTSAPLPVIDAKLQFNGRTRSGRFLVDTTKLVTTISHDFALTMGFDRLGNGTLEDDSEISLDLDRLGGKVPTPILVGDNRIRLLTDEGVDLVFDAELIGVYEPPAGIDGILGFDLFTSGWFDRVEGNPAGNPGYIDRMHFDLTASETGFGQLVLDVNPQFNQVVSPPPFQNDDDVYDVNGDGDIQPIDVLVLINHLNSTTSSELPTPEPGQVVQAPFLDVSGDNIASPLDVLQVINYLNARSNSAALAAQAIKQQMKLTPQSLVAVPEPSSLALLLAGALAMTGVALQRRQSATR